MNLLIQAAASVGMSTGTYCYNMLGEKQKLPKKMPYITPAKTSAIAVGVLTFAVIGSIRKPYVPCVGVASLFIFHCLDSSATDVKVYKEALLRQQLVKDVMNSLSSLRVHNWTEE